MRSFSKERSALSRETIQNAFFPPEYAPFSPKNFYDPLSTPQLSVGTRMQCTCLLFLQHFQSLLFYVHENLALSSKMYFFRVSGGLLKESFIHKMLIYNVLSVVHRHPLIKKLSALQKEDAYLAKLLAEQVSFPTFTRR